MLSWHETNHELWDLRGIGDIPGNSIDSKSSINSTQVSLLQLVK